MDTPLAFELLHHANVLRALAGLLVAATTTSTTSARTSSVDPPDPAARPHRPARIPADRCAAGCQ